MSSYFFIELDTTSPTIEIYSPTYTTREVSDEIYIISDESLGNWQEVYSIDSTGFRRDYTFSINDNEMLGIISFNDYPMGMVDIYVRVRDDLHNISSLYHTSLTVKNSVSALKLDISDFNKVVYISDEDMKQDVFDNNRRQVITNKNRNQDINTKDRRVDIKNESRL